MRGVSLRWRFIFALLKRFPQGVLSRGWGAFAELSFPRPVQRAINGGFARIAGVSVSESERPPGEYRTLSAFFSRALRLGTRQWPAIPEMPASPVDGILGPFGRLEAGIAIQAKGNSYRVGDLLAGESLEFVGAFDSGLFFTIYLSPRHYHRIHAPIAGELREARAVPGRLLPVNLPATKSIADLFPRNERLVVLLDALGTRLALVAIGAFNVGRISATFDPEWNGPRGGGVTNRPGRRAPEARVYDPPRPVARGEELMTFHFGSTVVFLVENAGPTRMAASHPALEEGMEICVGTPLLEAPLTGAVSQWPPGSPA